MRTHFKPTKTLLLLGALLITKPAFANLNILACEPEWEALAKELGGDKVETNSATNAFQDPHHIEARPSLIVKARNADVLFCTGAELEIGWLPLLLSRSSNGGLQPGKPGYFMAAEVVELIEKPEKVDRSMGDMHAAGNPHVHLDPYRVKRIAEQFTARLKAIDSEYAAYYEERFAAFVAKWDAAIKKWEAQTADIKGTKVIVYHKNWSYLVTWLGMEVVGDLEPKPGIPPTSAHLSQLLAETEQQQPKGILVANYQDKKGAKWLSSKREMTVLDLPFTVGGNDAATDLFSLYDELLASLNTLK